MTCTKIDIDIYLSIGRRAWMSKQWLSVGDGDMFVLFVYVCVFVCVEDHQPTHPPSIIFVYPQLCVCVCICAWRASYYTSREGRKEGHSRYPASTPTTSSSSTGHRFELVGHSHTPGQASSCFVVFADLVKLPPARLFQSPKSYFRIASR